MSYYKKFSKEKENQIVEMYLSGLDQVKIAKHFNTYNTSIRRVLQRKDIIILSHSERTRAILPTFFNNYDDPNIQYWLGVLASDGCITNGKLIFESKDREWVESFRDFLNPNINVNITQPKKGHTLYRVSCGVKGLEEELSRYGIVPDKSLKLEWKMPLTKDFVRGVFDGDGCVSISSKIKYPLISICGASKIFIEQIHIYLKENNIHSTINSDSKNRNNTLYTLYIHSLDHKKRLYHLFYDDAKYFLERKKERFSSILDKFYEKKTILPVQLNENGIITNYKSISELGRYLNIDHRKLSYWLQKDIILKRGYNVKYL